MCIRDRAYLQHDVDNVSRSTLSGRQLMYLTDPNYAAAPLLRRMVSAGHLGRKSGNGFYEY